jgi:metal-responsive CopG/Arc/MetJ family transcriptional regulator
MMMARSIEIVLPERVAAEVDALAAEDGMSSEEWIQDAIRARVFLRRFEQAREMILAELDARGEHYSDEDVFRLVS